MDPLSLIQAAVSASKSLYEAANQAKTNKKSCAWLEGRVRGIMGRVEQRYRGRTPAPHVTGEQLEALGQLREVLESGAALCRRFSSRNAFMQITLASSYKEQFRVVHEQLGSCHLDLLAEVDSGSADALARLEEAARLDAQDTRAILERMQKDAQTTKATLESIADMLRRASVGGSAASAARPAWEINMDEVEFDLDKRGRPRKIGSGSFGTVYAGSYRGHRAAIKEVNVSGMDDGSRRKVEEELAIAFPLEHPNIVRTFGAVLYDDGKFAPHMVMEFIDGKHLADALYGERKEAMDEPQRLQIATSMAHGLTYLHAHRPKAIVHRDIKPANVMLAPNGAVKLVDFGLACAKNTSAYQRTLAGAAQYRAPEIVRHEDYKQPVDIYSVGCVLIELWTRERPWGDLVDDEIAQRKRHYALPQSLDKMPASAARNIAAKCLAPDPKQRPTAAQLVVYFEAAVATAQDELPPPYSEVARYR